MHLSNLLIRDFGEEEGEERTFQWTLHELQIYERE